MLAALKWSLFIIAAYVSGGVMYSRLLPRLCCHVDVQAKSDDGNPGAANAVKLAGWRVGLCCLALDLAKGYIPVAVAARVMGMESWCFAAVMIAPVVGHATDPFSHDDRIGDSILLRVFAGGKAIACSFGVLAALLPQNFSVFILVALYIFFSVAVKINPNRVRSIVTYALLAVSAGSYSIIVGMLSAACGIVGVCAVVVMKHSRIFLIEVKNRLADAESAIEEDEREPEIVNTLG